MKKKAIPITATSIVPGDVFCFGFFMVGNSFDESSDSIGGGIGLRIGFGGRSSEPNFNLGRTTWVGGVGFVAVGILRTSPHSRHFPFFSDMLSDTRSSVPQ